MKNLKIKLLALVLSTSGFLVTSCSSEDEGTDSSVLEVNKNVVEISFSYFKHKIIN